MEPITVTEEEIEQAFQEAIEGEEQTLRGKFDMIFDWGLIMTLVNAATIMAYGGFEAYADALYYLWIPAVAGGFFGWLLYSVMALNHRLRMHLIRMEARRQIIDERIKAQTIKTN